MSFFSSMFGLTEQQTTALLGAHTVGQATGAAGLGFLGKWKEGEN
jgi:hypothetical protein